MWGIFVLTFKFYGECHIVNFYQGKARSHLHDDVLSVSYHYVYESYQREALLRASLPQILPSYRGPQDIYSRGVGYEEDHSREIYSAPGTNSGLQMVPRPQYVNVQHAPLYHHSALQYASLIEPRFPVSAIIHTECFLRRLHRPL